MWSGSPFHTRLCSKQSLILRTLSIRCAEVHCKLSKAVLDTAPRIYIPIQLQARRKHLESGKAISGCGLFVGVAYSWVWLICGCVR